MILDLNAVDVTIPAIDKVKLSRWIEKVSENHGYRVGRITYIFVNDEGILDVNRQFLQHDFYTDVITFDYSKRGMISGDIYISLDTVASNALQLGKKFDDELNRVLIHGILHLCGIKDKEPGEREIMEQHEDAALQLID